VYSGRVGAGARHTSTHYTHSLVLVPPKQIGLRRLERRIARRRRDRCAARRRPAGLRGAPRRVLAQRDEPVAIGQHARERLGSERVAQSPPHAAHVDAAIADAADRQVRRETAAAAPRGPLQKAPEQADVGVRPSEVRREQQRGSERPEPARERRRLCWKSSSEWGYLTPSSRRGHGDNVASMAWKLHAIEQTQLRRQYHEDGVGRPKFDFHTGRREVAVA
jgi:hypothetical protein